jgi:hypothetical protein
MVVTNNKKLNRRLPEQMATGCTNNIKMKTDLTWIDVATGNLES